MTNAQIEYETCIYLKFRTPAFRKRTTFEDFLISRRGEGYLLQSDSRGRERLSLPEIRGMRCG